VSKLRLFLKAGWIGEEAVRSTPTKIAVHVLVFVTVIVMMSALSIWLGLGPVVFSREAPNLP
jgi:hypothetical protein